jgi:exonuclease III
MKILAWNIRQGGDTRSLAIVESILNHKPDLVILSEFRNNASGHLIRTKLLIQGFSYQYASHQHPLKNGVLIASSLACDFRSFSKKIKDYPEALVCADFDQISVWGIYFPHKKKHTLFEFLMSEFGHRNHLLMGDFNTGKNYTDQKGDSFWYTDQLIQLERSGFCDAFRLLQGDVKEYSWFSHQKNGFRYDHAWVSHHLISRVRDCYYSKVEREKKQSDHALMLLKLDIENLGQLI